MPIPISIHHQAAEALGRGTSCIVGSRIGGFNEWDAALRSRYPADMSEDEIIEWSGHELGARMLDHACLTMITLAEGRRQITDVRHELEDLSGRTVDAFFFPYGDL